MKPARTLRIATLALLLLAVSACPEDVKQEERKATQDLLLDQFDATSFPTSTWTITGTGTLVQDLAVGAPAPAMRLDSTGTPAGLISAPLEAGAHFRVSIAIDPAPGSGASASFVLRNASGGAVVASVTVEEGQITYVMGAAAPVVKTWTTDGAFHVFEFEGSNSSVSGGHWWKRDGSLEASHLQPTGASYMTMGLEGTSSGNAWFDHAWVFRYLAYPH
ncbi:MAG: hypothetical protein M5U25_18895 [Planctomycetota bacterium]|nr:hypothetical protein [Planctomycetota bacterium]